MKARQVVVSRFLARSDTLARSRFEARARALHIVYVCAKGGGAETYVRQIAPVLCDLGQEVTIVYLCPPGEEPEQPATNGAIRIEHVITTNLHWYYDRSLKLAKLSGGRLPESEMVKVYEEAVALKRGLRRVAQRRSPISVIEFPEQIGFPAMFKNLSYGVKLHSSEAAWRYFCGEEMRPIDRQRNAIEARLLRNARFVTSPSEALADYVARACSYPRSRMVVLPYPMDLRHFTPNGSAPSKQSSVLYVGRLDPRKGLESLALAANCILEPHPHATLDIVGGETELITADTLLAHVAPGLRSRVRFHGRVPHDDLPRFYRQAAVCVVPSRWDNSPNTVYEALGCGRPVVASDVGGISELIKDGTTGILVPRDDPEALAIAVNALLSHPERRNTMGVAARKEAERRFDPTTIGLQTLQLYRDALAHSGHPGNSHV